MTLTRIDELMLGSAALLAGAKALSERLPGASHASLCGRFRIETSCDMIRMLTKEIEAISRWTVLNGPC